MRKCILYTLIIGVNYSALGQTISTDKNTIVHSKFRIPTAVEADATDPAKSLINVQYMDGLGRPLQKIGYQQSPTQKDMVSGAVEYDIFGRVVKIGLVAPSTSQTGAFQTNPLGLANTFYNDANAYTATTAFDCSPLNRSREQFGAGEAWRTENKKVQIFDELAGTEVLLYTVNNSNDLIYSNTYSAKSLYKKRIIDEQGNSSIEITDKSGRLIQKQQQDAVNYIITYYVYDDWGRLRAIIQPEGYKQIVIDANHPNIIFNSTEFNNWVFFYNYDYRGRLIEKKIPGAGWEYIVYDKRENPVLQQTALQRIDVNNKKWTFTKYDSFGRVVVTGELVNNQSRSDLQTLFDGVSQPYETWQGFNYSNMSYPNTVIYAGTDEKVWNFYDQYNWMASQWAFNSSTSYNAVSYYSNVQGLQTGSFARSSEDPNKVFHSVMHYDNKGRVIQTYQVHHKGGSNAFEKPIVTNFEYNFAGEIIKEKILYQIDGLSDNEVISIDEYDYAGRIKKAFHGINTTPTEIVSMTYDEVSRIRQKKILPNGTYYAGGALDYINRPPSPHPNTSDIARKAISLDAGTIINADDLTKYMAEIDPNAQQGTAINGLQTIDYSYHVRGYLKGINLDDISNPNPKASEGDLFSYKLEYETAGYWNGNIGKQYWQSMNQSNAPLGIRNYTFEYDEVSRLKKATYSGVGSENYSLPNMSYDKNGNITNLQRKGKISSGYGDIDALTYVYSGNRLNQVSDAISSNNEVDFIPRGTGNYTYYDDGSLKSDANEQIANIIYDSYLKQPTEIQLTDGRWIKYFYDGTGRLFKTEYSTGEVWDFLDKMILKNGQFYQMSSPAGRAVYLSSSWSYEFFQTDHLGNTRVAFKANGNQLEKASETAFDPWGMVLNGIGQINTVSNRFEFQGKESEKTFGLNRINLGARTLNSTIGRFDGIDLMAEQNTDITSYAVSLNNPIYYLDPDGRSEKPAHYEFLTTVGVSIYMQARQNGASTLGALVVLSQAANESAWGSSKVALEHFNYFGLTTTGPGSGISTSHGMLSSYSSTEEGINGYFDRLKRKWPNAIPLLGKENITSDELNQAFNTGKYQKSPAYFVADAGHTYDYGDVLMGSQMSSLLKRFVPFLDQKYSENSESLEAANRRFISKI